MKNESTLSFGSPRIILGCVISLLLLVQFPVHLYPGPAGEDRLPTDYQNPTPQEKESNYCTRDAEPDPALTFYTHITFTAIQGRKDDLWAVGNGLLFHIRQDDYQTGVIDLGLEGRESIHQLKRSEVALYLMGNESMYRYDLFSQKVGHISMPDNITYGNLEGITPFVWDAGVSNVGEGLVLFGEGMVTILSISGSHNTEIILQKDIDVSAGTYLWSSALPGRILMGFSNSLFMVDTERIVKMDEEPGKSGRTYARMDEKGRKSEYVVMGFDSMLEKFALNSEKNTGTTSLSLDSVESLWESPDGENIIDFDIKGDTITLISGGKVYTSDNGKEVGFILPGAEAPTSTGNAGYVLDNGNIFKIDPQHNTIERLLLNMPVMNISKMDASTGPLVTANSTAISILPRGKAPDLWTTISEIMEVEIKNPVIHIDEQNNIWVAQKEYIFRGVMENNIASWVKYSIPDLNPPKHIASSGNWVALLNETSLSLFNHSSKEVTSKLDSNTTTGKFITIRPDTTNEVFWVLCEQGFVRISIPENKSIEHIFFGEMQGSTEFFDMEVTEDILWILGDTAVSIYYKSQNIHSHFPFEGDMLGEDLRVMSAHGRETYIGGTALYHIDELSGVDGFRQIEFGNEISGKIEILDHGNIHADNTQDIYIIDSDAVRIFNTSQSIWRSLTTSNGLASNDVRQITKDPFSNELWISAYGGVTKYNTENSTFDIITSQDGLSNNFVYTTHIDEQGVWLGTDGGGVNIQHPDGHWSSLTREDGVAEDDVLMIKSAGENRYWFCTDGGLTLYDRPNSTFENFLSPSKLAGGWVWDIDQLDEKVYVATDNGISVWNRDTNEWTRFFRPLDMPSHEVFSVDLFEYNGNDYLWAGTSAGVVCHNITGDDWDILNEEDGIYDSRVKNTYFDGEEVWVGSGSGITVFSPEGIFIRSYDRRDGLVYDKVNSVTRIDEIMYISTAGGVSIFSENGEGMSLTPIFLETADNCGDIWIEDYEFRVTANEPENTPDGNLLSVNISVGSQVQGNAFLLISTTPIQELYGVIESLECLDASTETPHLFSDPAGSWVLLEFNMNSGINEIEGSISLNVSEEEIYFLVDPCDHWPESDENNNQLLVTPESPEYGNTPGDIPTQDTYNSPLWPSIVAGAFLMGIVAYFWMKKRSRNTGK